MRRLTFSLDGFGAGNVVAKDADFDPGAQFPDPLDEVIGEGVVIIDEDDHIHIVSACAVPVKPGKQFNNLRCIAEASELYHI